MAYNNQQDCDKVDREASALPDMVQGRKSIRDIHNSRPIENTPNKQENTICQEIVKADKLQIQRKPE